MTKRTNNLITPAQRRQALTLLGDHLETVSEGNFRYLNDMTDDKIGACVGIKGEQVGTLRKLMFGRLVPYGTAQFKIPSDKFAALEQRIAELENKVLDLQTAPREHTPVAGRVSAFNGTFGHPV